MRLLFVSEKLGYAGTSSYTLDLTLALKGKHEIRICTTGGALREVFPRHDITTYLVKFNLLSYRKFLDYLREYKPDLIHIQNCQSTRLGRRISRKLGIPHVITVHRLPHKQKPQLSHPLLAGVIAVNEVIREFLVNDQDVPKSLIRVIPRGVDVESLTPEAGRAASAPGRDLIPVLGSVGSLLPVRGHDVFLRAARRVLDMGVEAMFAVVGEGGEDRRLWRLAKELRLERYLALSPHIPDRHELYRVFDIVVVPTLRGGAGSAVLEAMAMGKPVVASAVGDILQIVQDGITGLLVPEGDVDALASRMAELISRPDLCRTLGEAARAHVVENFALSSMVQATEGFYEEIALLLREGNLSAGFSM